LEFESGNFASSVGSRHLPEGRAGVALRGFFGGGELLLTECEGVFILHIS
jgi:hypothetical protein